ncbi:MAG: hypothetical protein M1524_01140 [Patescibacteria group bacterium]|nr:hypothetical protein [Patescibacteria group bacterium]
MVEQERGIPPFSKLSQTENRSIIPMYKQGTTEPFPCRDLGEILTEFKDYGGFAGLIKTGKGLTIVLDEGEWIMEYDRNGRLTHEEFNYPQRQVKHELAYDEDGFLIFAEERDSTGLGCARHFRYETDGDRKRLTQTQSFFFLCDDKLRRTEEYGYPIIRNF